jgi:hypothetical protein
MLHTTNAFPSRARTDAVTDAAADATDAATNAATDLPPHTDA